MLRSINKSIPAIFELKLCFEWRKTADLNAQLAKLKQAREGLS
jgi:hypothetical protein